jgi:hypothetical protein
VSPTGSLSDLLSVEVPAESSFTMRMRESMNHSSIQMDEWWAPPPSEVSGVSGETPSHPKTVQPTRRCAVCLFLLAARVPPRPVTPEMTRLKLTCCAGVAEP